MHSNRMQTARALTEMGVEVWIGGGGLNGGWRPDHQGGGGLTRVLEVCDRGDHTWSHLHTSPRSRLPPAPRVPVSTEWQTLWKHNLRSLRYADSSKVK